MVNNERRKGMLPLITWQLDGNCSRTPLPLVDPIFFPDGRGKKIDIKLDLAKIVCKGCPVEEKCLDDAIETGEIYTTVRGGKLPHELQSAFVERGGTLKKTKQSPQIKK